MTFRQCERISRRQLLEHLPSFAAKEDLLFYDPIDELLRGFCYMRSGLDKVNFGLTVFVLPCYVPTDGLGFTFYRDLGYWNYSAEREAEIGSEIMAKIETDGAPFLSAIETPLELAGFAQEQSDRDENPHLLEALAYSWIRVGAWREAQETLATVQRNFAASKQDWLQDLLSRVVQVNQALARIVQ